MLLEPPSAVVKSLSRSRKPIRFVGDATPAELKARVETKLVYHGEDLGGLRCALQKLCGRVVHAGPVSTVSSVYFDDLRLGACQANLDGTGLRHKTRIRWYDRPLPGAQLFFETKWRRHRVTGKDRVELLCTRPAAELSLRQLHRALRQALPVERRGHLANDTEAVVLVEYEREHFLLEHGRARLTLDYHLRFYPLLGRRRLARRFPQRLPDVAVIECKTAVGDTRCLARVLSPLGGRPTRFSKYVTACQHLGYASHH